MIRKYLALFIISFKDRLSSPGDVVSRALFFAVVIFIFSRLWQSLAKAGLTDLGSHGANSLVWYLFITEAILLSLPPLPEQVDQEIQSGNIVYQLIRPIDYVGSRAVAFLGDVLARFSVNLIVGSMTCYWLVGGLVHGTATGLSVIETIPLIFGAFLIHLGISLTLSTLGFWVEDTLPFFWIYSKASFILGGLLMPIDYYPAWLQKLSRFFPLRDGLYSVAKFAVEDHAGSYLALFTRQMAWFSAGIACAMTLYHYGVKRLEAGGG